MSAGLTLEANPVQVASLGQRNEWWSSQATSLISHEMRNEVVEELIPDLRGERHTEPNVVLRKSGRNRGV